MTEAYCEDAVDGIGGIWVVTPDFSFCDVGNGIWVKAEECFNGDETCSSDQLYIESDTPNSLIVSYINEDGEYDLASPTVLSDVFLEDDVIDLYVCGSSEFFMGTTGSSFTNYINHLRYKY